MLLTNKQLTNALIRLHRSAGWLAPLLFTNIKNRVSRFEAHIKKAWQYKATNILKLCVAFVHPYAYKDVPAKQLIGMNVQGLRNHLPPAIK